MSDSTLTGNAPVVTIGKKSYTITPFTPAKFIRAGKLIAAMLKAADVSHLLDEFQSNQGTVAGMLVDKIPELLDTAEPYVLRFCALVLIANKELRRLADDGENIDNALDSFAKELSWDDDYTVEKIIDTVVFGVEQMGVGAIRKNAPRLAAAFRTIQS